MIDVTIQGKDCIFLMHAQEVADVHSRCGMEVMQLFIYYFDTYLCKCIELSNRSQALS